jgi:septum formation protein
MLLKQVGIQFHQVIPDIDESNSLDLPPYELAVNLAEKKALAITEQNNQEVIVLGCDTIVILGDKILGKPQSSDEAVTMLTQLEGNMHIVCSAVALAVNGRIEQSGYELTNVFFKLTSYEAIAEYVETGEPMDKAGAYGIQDRGVFLVDRFEGNIDNVIGLPLTLLNNLAGKLAEKIL